MTTRDKLTFVHSMARHTKATVRQCEALMRYAGTLARLAADDLPDTDWGRTERWKRKDKQKRITAKVTELCGEIGLEPGRRWKLTAPDSQRIRCQCGQIARYGRTRDGGAPFWYECAECWPFSPMFAGAVLKIRVPDGEEICVPS